ELEHARAVLGQHQAGVEQSEERRPAGGELGQHWPVDPVDELLDLALVQGRHRGERAHAAGVRAGVAIADALVVASGRERQRAAAVGEREDGQLLAVEQLLDDHRPTERAGRGERGVDLFLRRADEDALARRETVGLDDARGLWVGEARRGGHTRSCEDLLREALRSLDPRSGGAGPERGDPRVAQLVGDARDERRLRPDDDEVDVERASEADEPVAVVGAHRMALRECGDSRVAGRRVQLVEERAPAELPGERVLTSSGADDQHPHAASLRKRPARLRARPAAHGKSVHEPGLDQHEWRTQWEALEPDLADSPAEALPEVGRLIDEMLDDRGYEVASDPEIDRELEIAREIVQRLDAGETVDPGDLGMAVNAYRSVYEQLATEYRSP